MDHIPSVTSRGLHTSASIDDETMSSENTMTLSLFQSTPSHTSPFNGLGLFVPAASDPRESHDVYGQLWEVLRPLICSLSEDDSEDGMEPSLSSGTRRKSSFEGFKKFWSF